MNAAAIIITMLLLTAIPSGATGEETIPYIEIQYPEDGSTIETKETIVVVAEGYSLKNPRFSITGEGMGSIGPLTECTFKTMENGLTRMNCKQELDFTPFEEQKVKLLVYVSEGNTTLTDSVGLYVSGHCAW